MTLQEATDLLDLIGKFGPLILIVAAWVNLRNKAEQNRKSIYRIEQALGIGDEQQNGLFVRRREAQLMNDAIREDIAELRKAVNPSRR